MDPRIDERTLDELDPPAWGPPTPDDTTLVERCRELRQTPLAGLDVEDLRLLISQRVSLRHLIPRAIAVLQADPLAEGDFYPGDLLNAVLCAERTYWHDNVEQWQTVEEIASSLLSAVEHLREPLDAFRSGTFT